MNRRHAYFGATVAVVLLLLGSPSQVAAQSASLQGIVSDEASGQVLTNAFVSLESGGVEVRSVLTDRNGLFLIGGVAPPPFAATPDQ